MVDRCKNSQGHEFLDDFGGFGVQPLGELPRARGEATTRLLASLDALLPEDVRGAIREVGALAGDMGLRAHVVGGFVRDMLLGRRNLDVDVVVAKASRPPRSPCTAG